MMLGILSDKFYELGKQNSKTWGTRDRRFESSLPDQPNPIT